MAVPGTWSMTVDDATADAARHAKSGRNGPARPPRSLPRVVSAFDQRFGLAEPVDVIVRIHRRSYGGSPQDPQVGKQGSCHFKVPEAVMCHCLKGQRVDGIPYDHLSGEDGRGPRSHQPLADRLPVRIPRSIPHANTLLG